MAEPLPESTVLKFSTERVIVLVGNLSGVIGSSQMKLICAILIAVIALHTQCLASCYGMGDPSSAAAPAPAVPPCHDDHGDKDGNVPDRPSNHDDDACGVGLITPSKTIAAPDALLQMDSLPAIAVSAIVNEDAVGVFAPLRSPSSSASLPALKLKLRI